MKIFRPTVKKDNQEIQVKKWYCNLTVGEKRYKLPLFESEKISREFVTKLDTLIGQHNSGIGYDRLAQAWLSQLPPMFINRFAKMGLIDSARAEGGKPIDSHIDDYSGYLEYKGNTKAYRALCKTRLKKVVNDCKFRTLTDLSASKIQRYISDELTAEHISQGTFNHYIRQWKGFLRWLYREDRIQADMAKHLHLRSITAIEKDRRALTIEEIAYLLDWVAAKGKQAYGLSGWERMVLYKLALTTGLRANEIRVLKVGSVDAKGKSITVPSGYTKNRKEAVLPLRDDVISDLKQLATGKLPDTSLFRRVTDKTADMLREDMADARGQWIQEGATEKENNRREKRDDFLKAETDDGQADFHALRHSFATMLVSGGADVKTAQSLLRHSSPMLTLGIYSHVLRESEQAAVAKLPTFEKDAKESKKQA